MRKLISLVFISLILVVYSCQKDELTEPTSVDLEFSMDSYTCNGDGGAKSGTSFEMTEGTMIVESIEFDGRRDVGEDYFFTSDFSEPLIAQMHIQQTSQNVSYDIPQGVYNRIELNFSIGDGNEDALCLQGKYQKGPLDEIEIRFEYSFKEQIRVRARNNKEEEQIVLKSNADLKAKVIFDVPHFFQFVNMNMIKNAEVIQVEGKDLILINSNSNTNIFNVLIPKLDNSIRVIFDE
jgi:hypothetical protein